VSWTVSRLFYCFCIWKEDDDTLFTSVVYIIGMRLPVVSIMRCPWIQVIDKIANEYVWFRRT
jgi:hypothetical protein